MDQVALFFKCIACSEYRISANIQCPSRHQVCHTCFLDNLTNCPICRQRVGPSQKLPQLSTSINDPIVDANNLFDLITPKLLRLTPALHPCSSNEMIFFKPNNCLNGGVNGNLQQNGLFQQSSMADQLLVANPSEVEETLSRLLLLASVSPSSQSGYNQSELLRPEKVDNSSSQVKKISEGTLNTP